ncbi:hypothetical protein Q1695_005058 [Nippostrongylus brasiliensis]|nr:hypothetical protein Q1695_005058 [Nippostrongylus brasiliensis]
MTPLTCSELGVQVRREGNPFGYMEKVLEWFRKNDEYNKRTEHKNISSASGDMSLLLAQVDAGLHQL